MQYPPHIQALLLNPAKGPEAEPVKKQTAADLRIASQFWLEMAAIAKAGGNRQAARNHLACAAELEADAQELERGEVR